MEILKEKTIGEMVAEDYRAAEIFNAYGIDFCCKGNKTLEEVCQTKGIDKEALWTEISHKLSADNKSQINYASLSQSELAEHIEKKHHKYVEEKMPVIQQYLVKICSVHGKQHPELFEIHNEFNEAAGELAVHMKKEELVLFPYIKRMVSAGNENSRLTPPHFGTVTNPVNMMRHDHDVEGDRFRRIAELSNNYTPPPDACNTYKVTYAMLKEFESDLHLHIHLENNILFPRAIEMELNLK